MGRPKKDILGLRFGRLVVVKAADVGTKTRIRWLCQCDCGNDHVTYADALLRGHTRSCGCFRREKVSKMKTTHGLSSHPLYNTWQEIMGKCYHPSHPRYHLNGFIGIKVCDRWHDFDAFTSDMPIENKQRGQVLIRLDKAGDYSPENCRWGSRGHLFRKK